MPKRIAVLGTGANGANIGADLTNAGHDVVLIDQWPENVETMRQQGLRIEMPDEVLEQSVRAFHLCDVCTFTEPFDIVLLLFKAYDTRWAAHLIAPYLKPDGLLAGVQNGMTTDVIAEVVGAERTIGCVIEISAAMFDPATVMRHSPPSRSWFAVGSIDPATRGRESEVADLLSHSGTVEIVDDIRATKWMKLVSNATTLVSTGLLEVSIHDAAAQPGMRNLMIRAGQEALDTGVALGHPVLPIFGLKPEDMRESNRLVDMLLDTLLSGFTLKQTITTVLQDWMKGRHSEVDDLNGLVAAEAARLGRRAPVNAAIAELGHRIEAGTLKPGPDNLALLKELVGD
ncbi:MAG: ketopantoate reductase family protein [Hyphomicrobiales bacterium]|nr:ketopantoate reductase family protein [Hyphomicrobiales bacterium]